MKKMTSVMIIILAILLLTSCGTTDPIVKGGTSSCSKVMLPDIPKEEQLPEARALVPGKTYTPRSVEVTIPRSSWNLLQLYHKSLQHWIGSAIESVNEHNGCLERQLESTRKESSAKSGLFW